MALSEEKKDSLRLLYEFWGVDRVREELANEEENPLLPGDVVAYARHWLAAEEVRRQRIFALGCRVVAFALILFVGTLVALLIL